MLRQHRRTGLASLSGLARFNKGKLAKEKGTDFLYLQ